VDPCSGDNDGDVLENRPVSLIFTVSGKSRQLLRPVLYEITGLDNCLFF